jgi:hypothetical protein
VTGWCVFNLTLDGSPPPHLLASTTPARFHLSLLAPPLPLRPCPPRHRVLTATTPEASISGNVTGARRCRPPRNLTSTPPPPRTSLRSATSLAGTPPSLPLWAGPPPVTRKAHNATGRGEAFSIYISNTQRLNHDHCMVCWFYYKLLYETLCCVLELCTLLYQIFFPLIYFFFRF